MTSSSGYHAHCISLSAHNHVNNVSPKPCTWTASNFSLQALEGVLYDNASITPFPLPQLDLAHLGPMKLPRVWSAIHDALLYADPRVAAGGRVRKQHFLICRTDSLSEPYNDVVMWSAIIMHCCMLTHALQHAG
jgi:hypothetical protein